MHLDVKLCLLALHTRFMRNPPIEVSRAERGIVPSAIAVVLSLVTGRNSRFHEFHLSD
jgi:hypothetical protein